MPLNFRVVCYVAKARTGVKKHILVFQIFIPLLINIINLIIQQWLLSIASIVRETVFSPENGGSSTTPLVTAVLTCHHRRLSSDFLFLNEFPFSSLWYCSFSFSLSFTVNSFTQYFQYLFYSISLGSENFQVTDHQYESSDTKSALLILDCSVPSFYLSILVPKSHWANSASSVLFWFVSSSLVLLLLLSLSSFIEE